MLAESTLHLTLSYQILPVPQVAPAHDSPISGLKIWTINSNDTQFAIITYSTASQKTSAKHKAGR